MNTALATDKTTAPTTDPVTGQTTTSDQNTAALAALDRGLSQIEPGLWIAHRQRSLRVEACHMRSGINVAKSMSLGSLVISGGVGLLFGATGVGLIGGGISALTYVAVLLSDKMDTDRFAPLPFVRTRLADRLETIGNAESRELRSQWESAQRSAGHSSFEADEELHSNLPAELSDEAMMLAKHGGLVANLLSQLPVTQRDLAYLHLCTAHRTFGDAMTGLTLERLTDQMQGRVGGNYLKMSPAELRDYQPPAYAIEQESTAPFGELPPVAPLATATTIENATIQPTAQSPQYALADETLAALKAYIQQPKNLVMVASGGAGKGITLANLCRFRAEADPTFKAIWLDPKNDPDETGYMAHPSITAIRFSAAELPGDLVVRKVREMLNTFRDLCAQLTPKTPVWLILDEWYFVLSVLQQYDPELLDEVIGMIRATVSLMDAKHKHIVLVGQSPNLDDLLPGQGGLMANLNTLCLFKRDSSGIKLLEKAGQTGVMPRKQATAQRLYQAAAQSPRDRAIFFGDRLWPVPELTNYGNYDRDSGMHLGKESVSLMSLPAPAAIAQPREFNPDDIQPTARARTAISLAYAESNAAAKIHPKAQRFAEVVGDYFALNPERQTTGLGKIINGNAKLSALRKDGKKDVIERLMHLAADANLIQIEEVSGGWSIRNPQRSADDELDFEF